MTYYKRHLPHWQPESAVIFLTVRLHGSLPLTAPVRHNGESPGRAFAAIDQGLDKAETGPRWLSDQRVAQCVVDVLYYGERELELYQLRTWVIMINHVHILIHPKATLPRITKAIKNFRLGGRTLSSDASDNRFGRTNLTTAG